MSSFVLINSRQTYSDKLSFLFLHQHTNTKIGLFEIPFTEFILELKNKLYNLPLRMYVISMTLPHETFIFTISFNPHLKASCPIITSFTCTWLNSSYIHIDLLMKMSSFFKKKKCSRDFRLIRTLEQLWAELTFCWSASNFFLRWVLQLKEMSANCSGHTATVHALVTLKTLLGKELFFQFERENIKVESDK